MRADLNTTFQTQMALPGRKPRQFAIFNFDTAGQVIVSDTHVGATGDVTFTDVLGCTATGNNLVKTAVTGWDNAGAVSAQRITGDGGVEFECANSTDHFFLGLSNQSTVPNLAMDFCIWFRATGQEARIREDGLQVFASPTWVPGDRFSIERVDGTVYYKKNGTTIYTSTKTNSTDSLIVDVAMNTQGSEVVDCTITGAEQHLVEDWGVLTDIASGDPKNHEALETRQMTLTLLNTGATPFSNYFASDVPENVEVDLYQWFDDGGQMSGNEELIDTFVAQDPIDLSEANPLLTLDLVSINMRYDNPCGTVIDTDTYANAAASAIGKPIDLIFGTPGEVTTLCSKESAKATLASSILSGTTTIDANEDLSRFPASGTIQLDEEQATYSSRTSSAFTVSARGANGTEAAEHLSNTAIVEVITDHTHIIGKGPIQSVSNVKVAGQPNLANYTEQLSSDPATITFTEPPYAVAFARAASFLEMQFDSVNAANTATNASSAFDSNSADVCTLNATYPKFSVKQDTVMEDRGEIVKAYLIVEHYESGNLPNDYAQVTLDGTVLGNLAQPADVETVTIDADVDIDHGHSHSITGEHTHTFTVPTVNISDPNHSHGFSSTVTVIGTGGATDDATSGTYLNVIDGSSVTFCQIDQEYGGHTNGNVTATFPAWSGGAISQVYICIEHLSASTSNGEVVIDRTTDIELADTGGVKTTQKFAVGTSQPTSVKVLAKGTNANSINDASSKVYQIYLEVVTASTSAASTNVSTIVSGGSNATATDKATDDVDDLVTANKPVNINGAEQTSRTFANIFDITDTVNFDWSWFTGKDLVIDYIGTADSQKVYLLHVFFDVEYKKREIIFSDDITCEPVGLIDDGAGTITGTPSALISRPDYVWKYLLQVVGGMPAAKTDASTFAAAGTLFASLGYTVDGVISGNLTLKEAARKLSAQTRSRCFYNAGLAKLKVRQAISGLTADKALTTADFREKSFTALRQNVTDIINTINLAYAKDHTDSGKDIDAYTKITKSTDATSITKHGTLEQRDKFLFDLVTQDAMASNLLAFYISELAAASTFYTFEVFLPHLDLEKEDILELTTPFMNLSSQKAVVRAIDRTFGSGKLSKINVLKITVEVFA